MSEHGVGRDALAEQYPSPVVEGLPAADEGAVVEHGLVGTGLGVGRRTSWSIAAFSGAGSRPLSGSGYRGTGRRLRARFRAPPAWKGERRRPPSTIRSKSVNEPKSWADYSFSGFYTALRRKSRVLDGSRAQVGCRLRMEDLRC
jgi:hypothetical protein